MTGLSRGKRRLLLWLAGAGATITVLAALILVAPTHIARYLLDDQLEAMGIDAEGVRTLDIDVWNREVWLGPVRFRAGDADFGELERIGLKIGLGRIFGKKIEARRLIVEGVSVMIRRGEHGSLSINGVDLGAFARPDQTAEDVAVETAEEGAESAWQAGLTEFELRASRFTYEDAAGRRVEAVVDRLELEDFHPWAPEQPGRVDLSASVNGMALAWAGNATPFAETIAATFEGRITNINLAAIEQAIGPLGFERHGGVYRTQSRHRVTVTPDRLVTIVSEGEIAGADTDLVSADGMAAKLGNLGLKFDATAEVQPGATSAARGRLDLRVGEATLGLPDAREVRLDGAALKADDFAVAVDGAGAVRISGAPSLRVERPALGGPAEAAARSLAVDAAKVEITSADAMTATGDLGVVLEGLDVGGPSPLTAETLAVDLSALTVRLADDRMSANGKARVDMAAVALGGPMRLDAARIGVNLEPLKIERIGDEMAVTASGRAEVSAPNVAPAGEEGVAGPSLAAETLSTGLEELGVRLRGGETTVDGRVGIEIAGATAEIPQPGGAGRLEADKLSVAASPLALALGPSTTTVRASGAVDVAGLSGEWPKGEGMPLSAATLRQLHLDLSDAALILSADGGQSPIDGGFAGELDDLKVTLGETGNVGKLDLAQLRLDGGSLSGALPSPTIAAETVVLVRPQVDVTDAAFGAFGGQPDGAPDRQPAGAEPGGGPTPVRIKIGRLAVDRTGTLVYVDTSVRPRVRLQTDIDILEAESIDTGAPDQRSPVRVDTTVNEFTKVQLVGWVAPFAEPPSFSFAGRVGDLSLPTLSPYAAQAVGMNLEQGSLTAKADAEALRGELNGRIQLDVANLAFSPLSKEDAERLSARIGLPIDTIVALLKDSGGQIRIDIPISGDLKNPSFDLTDAITQALVGAIRTTIVAPFRLLFEPVRIVAGAVGSGPPVFKPVTFEPGGRQLAPEARVFLDAVIDMLKKRPNLRVDVCGRATAEDLAAVRAGRAGATPAPGRDRPTAQPQPVPDPAARAEAGAARPELEALAVERGAAVRRYLLEQGAVPADRVGECRSIFDATDQGPPRAELTL